MADDSPEDWMARIHARMPQDTTLHWHAATRSLWVSRHGVTVPGEWMFTCDGWRFIEETSSGDEADRV